MSNTETFATVSKLVADRMIADASAAAAGLISVEAVARRAAYYQNKVNASLPGMGGFVIRIAMEAVKATL